MHYQGDLFETAVARTLLDQLLVDSRMFKKSTDYMNLLDFVVRMRNFAPFNALLLQILKPGLRVAASAKDWKKRFGRTIKEDARPLLILLPFAPVALVYDLLDTEGMPLPEHAYAFPARGWMTKEDMDRFSMLMSRKCLVSIYIDVGDNRAGSITVIKRAETAKDKPYHEVRINRNHDPNTQFATMVALKGDKEIGDKINKLVGRLADANDSLKGAINVADFNDEEKLGKGREMVDRLTKLVAIFEGLDFGRNRAEGDDLLGDAYEYLMRHFATESGKSKGQFYTPAEVSRVMSMVIDLGNATNSVQAIYDPTCGSGSLLLKAHDEAKGRTGLDLALYGQEMDNATSALARMNMVLHDCPTAEIWQGNTLSSPHFKNADGGLKTCDFVIANFPFSNKNWTSGLDPAHDFYGRFEYGIPPAKNGDYAFLLHILASLKSTGKGAVILPHGVLFRGGAEAAIRKNIVRRGFIKGIIGLPANLFYGTGIPARILVLDKEGAAGRRGIFMVDGSRGFIKDGNKNRLRAQDIHRIVDTFTRQVDIPHCSRMAPLAEIEANDFNLNLPRYIDSSEPEDLQDIEAHMKGGIPNRDIDGLDAYWQVIPSVRAALFTVGAGLNPDVGAGLKRDVGAGLKPAPTLVELKVAPAEIKPTIFGHPEFTAFNTQVTQRFESWKQASAPLLTGIQLGDRPRRLIDALSESLLETFQAAPLIDPYDVYQSLMDYWAETMQDDAWMLVSDGWQAMQDGKPNSDLIPAERVIARYFAAHQFTIEELEGQRDAITRQMEAMDEECGNSGGGEDGLLAEAKTEKSKLTAKSVKDRLKAIRHDKEFAEERKALEAYAALIDQEAAANKGVKEGRKALDALVVGQVARRPGCQRAGRTGPGQSGPHRPHPATGGTLCHAAAQAGRGSGNPGCARG